MDIKLAKTYEPSEVEDRIYRSWLDGGYFHAEVDKKKKPYTIVIPPPNITGQLHMGHALDNTLQDILIRWRRMQGYCALWVPGTDHASIATEAKIVEALKKEGLSKEAIGRDEFLRRAWEWKDKYSSRIISQLKKLGSSCDWDRTRFTLDEGCSKAVKEVFCNLYEKGLIYRGERIINWCPHCLTSISDAEVEYEEKDGFFWHLRYPLKDGTGYVELATTRPETLLGDTAVAVHPDDDRYKSLIGKTVILPLVGREIPIIADEYVERDFGTGVVKITPAHDPNDFEVGLRHKLPVINIMRENAEINENGGKYEGLSRDEARRQIVKDLEEGGFLVKTEPIKHNVGSCYRCHTIVEPRVSKQWFVKMKPLAQPAIESVRSGEVRFEPDRFAKIYYNWMDNIRDWCISRQLWWGHRIPAWYCADCGEVTVSRETPHACPKCGSDRLRQDPDTLDTWFSSALWPFSTLGWPDKTPELEYFYPTNTLVTSYDIIFFWVARMIFSGIEHTGRAPFDTVYIHGLMRDAQGRKMSKSLGNGIDPLEVVDKYGADALRFTLATGNSAGNDMRYIPERVESNRNFCNKIWNAGRFILMNIDGCEVKPGLPEELTPEDKWIVGKYNRLVSEVTDNLEKFDLGVGGQKVYDFFWDSFCDWYIELAKSRLSQGGEAADGARRVLVYIMTNTLKLLHPFMPFITEEIWQALPHEGRTIMLSDWPVSDPALDFPVEEANMERIMSAIRAIRNRRAEMNVPPSKKSHIYIETQYKESFDSASQFFPRLAFASSVETGDKFDIPSSVRIVSDGAVVYIPFGELVDIEKEIARLTKEKENCAKQLAASNAKLSNQGFTSKAPEQVVASEREKAKKLGDRIAALDDSIGSMKKQQ
jgi:valyl-tRNA synthetase